MILHNLKQILRGMLRYKSFTFINVLGLCISLAAIVVIFLIDDFENSFDSFHGNNKNIYRVVSKVDMEGKNLDRAIMPYPLAHLLRSESAGIKATEIHFVKDMNVKIGSQAPFDQKNIVFADSLFFQVLNFSKIKNFWLRGNASALKDPKKAILTESTAKRYFGKDDPIGKIIRLDNKADVQIAGVVKDIPATSHLPAAMFVSFSTLTKDFIAGLDLNEWSIHSSGYCYVRLNDPADVNGTEKALYNVVQKTAGNEREKKERMYLQQLGDIHFNPLFENENPSYTVSKRYLEMLLLLGGFILLIACVNYINLSTSLAFSKSKEVGIRKTIGASKAQLFTFYLSETFIITFIAALTGIVLACSMIPSINHLLDKSIDVSQLLNIKFFISGILLIVVISFISGAYPALILAGFNPIDSLKNQLSMPGKSSSLVRKGLVVFQFTTSIALIICTIIIAKQVNYFNSKSLGFNKDAVVEVGLPVNDSAKMESFRNLLHGETGIQKMSFCLGAPISDNGFSTSMEAPQLSSKADYSIKVIPCDTAYLETYGIQLLAGRWFFNSEQRDTGRSIVINETAARTLGYKKNSDALGRQFKIGINNYRPVIIGVIKDFHTTSLHQGIGPVGLLPFRFFYYAAAIRINPASVKSTLAKIESAWQKIYPNDSCQVKFIDETLAARYEQETKDFNLFKTFSGISIFICCIGLWGLIAFVVSSKTKEIGIRKVLGATVNEIVLLLSKDFIRLVLIALIIASPLAWYFMNQWLNNFAYRVNISLWVFVLAGVFAIVIALITISFQAIKAALANPVKSLRTE